MAGSIARAATRGIPGALAAPHAGSAPGERRWSLRIGRVFGIQLYAHLTFVMFLLWIAASNVALGGGLEGALGGVGFVTAVFAIVILHELGHALTARAFDIPTRDITLYPFGGIASLERIPREPKQELAIAAAGPAVNVVLALVFGAASVAMGGVPLSFAVGFSEGSMLASLAGINLTLAVFNLLPAFPMDGGRVFRATLALRLGFPRATEVAARVGQIMAIMLGILGLLANPMLLIIALFVWLGGQAEVNMTRLRLALEGLPTGRAILANFVALDPNHSLAEASRLFLGGGSGSIPVMSAGRVIGVVTRRDVVRGLASAGEASTVGSVMRPAIVEATADEPLLDVVERISREGADLAVVSSEGRLLGIVTLDIIENLVLFRGALRHGPLARTMQASVA